MHYLNCVTQSHSKQGATIACTTQDSDSSLHSVYTLHAFVYVNVCPKLVCEKHEEQVI